MTFEQAKKRVILALAAGVITHDQAREALLKTPFRKIKDIPEGKILADFMKELLP